MKRYSEDDRGRIFRWDGQLEQWHRIMSYDEEYEAAVRSLRDATARDAADAARDDVARDAARMPAQRPADFDERPAEPAGAHPATP